jgi:ubiquinone/menaquinone biosynthesis C-methylase UbiE
MVKSVYTVDVHSLVSPAEYHDGTSGRNASEAAMTDDSPSIEDRARAVFSERADLYVSGASHVDPQVLGWLVELAQPQPTWRMLDVATGAGHTAFAFAPYVTDIVGIDLTPRMLAEAQKLASQQGVSNVHFVEADIHELPFDDETFDDEQFDLVTCRRGAHHFSDIEEALAEMVRMLKPGGLMLIDDRSLPEDDFVDGIMNRLDWLHDESHVREYRPSQWRAMLEMAGCRVLTMETYTRHRPLSSLTERVSPQNVAQIHSILASLSTDQRRKLALEEIGGELYSNHWYVIIAARKTGG